MIRFFYRTEQAEFEVKLNLRKQIADHYAKRYFGSESVSLKEISLDQDGITLVHDRYTLSTSLRHWPEYWHKFQHMMVDGRIEGQLACRCWSAFIEYWMEQEAPFVLSRIRLNDLTFQDVLEKYPLLLEHVDLQKALTTAWAAGELGKPSFEKSVDSDKWLLYAYAVGLLRDGKYKLMIKACVHVCDEHKELVPDSWSDDILIQANNLEHWILRKFGKFGDKDPKKTLYVRFPE